MKKIIYFLILLLTFKDVLYSKTEIECSDLIVTRKGKWYLGREHYYNNEYVDTNQRRDIFKSLNNDELNRVYYKYDFWDGMAEGLGLFWMIGFMTSTVISIEEPHSTAAKVSWAVTGSIIFVGIISIFIGEYYQNKAIDTYNRIIMENRNIIDNETSKSMKHKNVDVFSIGFSHKCDF